MILGRFCSKFSIEFETEGGKNRGDLFVQENLPMRSVHRRPRAMPLALLLNVLRDARSNAANNAAIIARNKAEMARTVPRIMW